MCVKVLLGGFGDNLILGLIDEFKSLDKHMNYDHNYFIEYLVENTEIRVYKCHKYEQIRLCD